MVSLAYLVVSVICATAIRSCNFRNPGFSDGALIGAAFYLMVPMVPILLNEGISAYPIRAEEYRPFEDLATTMNLFVGVLVLCAAANISRFMRNGARGVEKRRSAKDFDIGSFAAFISVYAVLAIATFLMSGKASGGHWMGNMEAALSADTGTILVANFKNAYRTAAFGLLLFLAERGYLKRYQAFIVGVGLATFDLVLSFNRITFAYLAIATIIIYRRQFWAASILFIAAIFPFSYVSSFWSTFRALVLSDGLTATGIERAAIITNSVHGNSASGINNILNSIFESSNIVVFNWIVKAVPYTFDPLWGWTLIVRPITIFVPSTIWPDKPEVFGTVLGKEIQNINGLALNSTFFGEMYANFYFWWLFVLAALVVSVDYIYSKVFQKSPVYGYCAMFVGFACWRFDFTFATISLLALGFFELTRVVVRKIFNLRN